MRLSIPRGIAISRSKLMASLRREFTGNHTCIFHLWFHVELEVWPDKGMPLLQGASNTKQRVRKIFYLNDRVDFHLLSASGLHVPCHLCRETVNIEHLWCYPISHYIHLLARQISESVSTNICSRISQILNFK